MQKQGTWVSQIFTRTPSCPAFIQLKPKIISSTIKSSTSSFRKTQTDRLCLSKTLPTHQEPLQRPYFKIMSELWLKVVILIFFPDYSTLLSQSLGMTLGHCDLCRTSPIITRVRAKKNSLSQLSSAVQLSLFAL